ncbi:MAG TPA: cytochrome c oxidase subunit II [Bryobacteraceae bacterium]|nr:cytochrome c oxidase subunit II [Bryobacteraceae bacterium]
MGSELPLFPVQASSVAASVDHLVYFLLAVAVFFSVGIFVSIFYFAVRYRRRFESEVPPTVHGGMTLEIAWTVIPFGLTMIMFMWGASIFFKMSRPPDDAQEVYVVGKQWMWKMQHMEGQREINELHIPVGQAMKLTMTSEDVIHDFFVPAFRTKADVLPGRYTTTWFKPTKPGKYHLFCSQYCGTNHSLMVGWIYVMEPQDYQAWLSGGATGSLASSGEKLFQDLACANCHHLNDQGRCPNLRNLFGSQVPLSDGSHVLANEDYIRESILNPSAKIVAGYQPIMPTFQGLVTEENVLQLIEYIKSLTPKPGAAPAAGAAKSTQVKKLSKQ